MVDPAKKRKAGRPPGAKNKKPAKGRPPPKGTPRGQKKGAKLTPEHIAKTRSKPGHAPTLVSKFIASEVELKFDDYFHKCDLEKRPYTIMGLANTLRLSRAGLHNYAKGLVSTADPDMVEVVRFAKARVEQSLEERLLTQKSVAGPIFNLKNNYEWKDERHLEQNVNDRRARELSRAELEQIASGEDSLSEGRSQDKSNKVH